jgi:hypothetical protein
VKFEDGTAITSKDVKYAVERSIDKDVLVNGPTYFDDFLTGATTRAPTRARASSDKAIDTPDDRTIVFHLKDAFGGFDYLAMLPMTAGAGRQGHRREVPRQGGLLRPVHVRHERGRQGLHAQAQPELGRRRPTRTGRRCRTATT